MLLAETDPQIAGFITKRMVKEVRRYKTTKPFHAARNCNDAGCVWHSRPRRRRK